MKNKKNFDKLTKQLYLEVNGVYNLLYHYQDSFILKGEMLALLNIIKDMICEASQIEGENND